MITAVVWLELVRATRRGRLDRLRLALGFFQVVLFSLWLFVLASNRTATVARGGQLTPLPHDFQPALVFGLWLQYVLLLLAAPIFAAGSITDEKTAGTLDYLLITPLGDRDVIVGKWLALLYQLLTLALPAAPLLIILCGGSGVPADWLLPALLAPLVPVPAVLALALLASVWSRRTPPALIGVYLSLVAVFSVIVLFGLFDWLDPTRPAFGGGWEALGEAALVWAVPVVPCLVLASLGLRPLHERQRHRLASSRSGDLPPIVGNAVRWKERHLADRSGLPLLGWVPRWLGLLAVVGITLPAHVVAGLPGLALIPFLLGTGVAVLSGLLVGTRAAASITAEREGGTWATLLLVPDPTEQVLRAKLWGLLDAALPYQLAYLGAAVPGAILGGPLAVVAVALPWLGSWVLMYFTAAVGLECSARLGSSWQALASALFESGRFVLERTLTFGVLGGIACGALFYVLWLDPMFGAGVGALLIACVFLLAQAEVQIEECALWINLHERVPQGGDRFRKPGVRL